MIFATLGIVALLGACGFFAWERHQMCTAEIEGSLRKHHATDIEIVFDWMDFDHGTFTYDVQYRDRDGKAHHNRCKVTSRGYPADESVYWVDPIDPPRG
jgi:hypothetical protein